MDIQLDIWLRGTTHATSHVISPVGREPRAWTDEDVQAVLVGMLRALDRANDPQGTDERPVALRGFSWIVTRGRSGRSVRHRGARAVVDDRAGDRGGLASTEAGNGDSTLGRERGGQEVGEWEEGE